MKIQSNIFLLLFFLNVLFNVTYSQQSFEIKGTISNSCTKDSVNYIKGAEVSLRVDSKIKMRVKSDDNGSFRFYNLDKSFIGRISICVYHLKKNTYEFSEFEIDNSIQYQLETNKNPELILLDFDLCTNREKRNTTKNIFVTNINNQQESPEIHYPFHNSKPVFSQKKDSNIVDQFNQNLSSSKNILFLKKYRKIYYIDKQVFELEKKDTFLRFYDFTTYFATENSVYYFDIATQNTIKLNLNSKNCHVYSTLICDSLYCYNKDKLCEYKGEFISYIGSNFFKTRSKLLKFDHSKNDFIEIRNINVSTVKLIKDSYIIDKNDVYYDGKPLNIPKANLNKVTFFNNSSYFFTDSEFVYFKNERLKLDFSSFNYISDHFFFDQKGIYQLNYSWISHGKDSISTIPFKFIKPINRDSVVYYAQQFIRYENQLFDISKNLFYYNVPYEFLKLNQINVYELSPYVDSNSIFTYNSHFYKYKNKLHKTDSKKVYNVDIKTFKELFVSNYFTGYFKDKDHVYIYNQSGRFNILDSVSPSTFREFKPIFGMMQDDQYAYFENNRLFKISDIESIDYISYQRPQLPPPGCGLDKSRHHFTSSFLLKNKDGYWLVNSINYYDYEIDMDRQEIKYRRLSNSEMREIDSLKKKNAIQMKSML